MRTDAASLLDPIPALAPSDKADLHRQLTVVERRLQQGWWTIAELAEACGGSPAGVSARIRDCRKLGWEVVRRSRGKRLFEYCITGRAPLAPKSKPRDVALDELRARIERLERAASLPYSLPDEVEG